MFKDKSMREELFEKCDFYKTIMEVVGKKRKKKTKSGSMCVTF
jgi:hypothetical protein